MIEEIDIVEAEILDPSGWDDLVDFVLSSLRIPPHLLKAKDGNYSSLMRMSYGFAKPANPDCVNDQVGVNPDVIVETK